MSLPRQDIRFKLDHDVHAKLKVLCAVSGVEIHDLIESVLVPVIENKCHAAMLVMQELQRQGISGSRRDEAGKAGIDRESWSATMPGNL